MGAEGAVGVLYAKEAKTHENPAEFIKEKEEEYRELFANPTMRRNTVISMMSSNRATPVSA